jgi:hypothetical protein
MNLICMKNDNISLARVINSLIKRYLESNGIGDGFFGSFADFVAIGASSQQFLSSDTITIPSGYDLRLESRMFAPEHVQVLWQITRQTEGGLVAAGTYRTRDAAIKLTNAGVYNVSLTVKKADGTLIANKSVTGFITVEPGAEPPPPPPPPPPPDPIYLGYRTQAQGDTIDDDVIAGVTDPDQHMQLSMPNNHSFPSIVDVRWKTLFGDMDEFGVYHMWIAVPTSVQSVDYLYRQNIDFTISKGTFDEIGSRFSVSEYKVYRLDLTSPVNLRLGVNPF